MSDNTKKQLISAGYTFAATFISAFGTALLAAGTIELTGAFWISLVVTALREAVKAIVNTFVPVRLGGRKVV